MNADRDWRKIFAYPRLSSLILAYSRLCSLNGKKIMEGAARGHDAEWGMPGSRGRGRSPTAYLLRLCAASSADFRACGFAVLAGALSRMVLGTGNPQNRWNVC